MQVRHELYWVWANMKARCTNPNRPDFYMYGGRGVKYCERWKSFEAWLEDVGPRPAGCTLDRIDNSKDYEPGNVCWRTPKQQANNTRRNVHYEIEGVCKTLAEWADHYKLDRGGYKRAHERIKNGWEPQRALETPPTK